jgi:dienelactone hydrolase
MEFLDGKGSESQAEPLHPGLGGRGTGTGDALERCAACLSPVMRRLGPHLVRRRKLVFRSQAHKLHGYIFTPITLRRGPPPPVLILTTGFSATQHMGLLDTAMAICARTGVATMTYDHLGFGESEGERHQFSHWTQTVGYLDAITYLRQHEAHAVDLERICLWGESLSARLVLVVAAVEPQVKAVIAVTPPCGRKSGDGGNAYGVGGQLAPAVAAAAAATAAAAASSASAAASATATASTTVAAAAPDATSVGPLAPARRPKTKPSRLSLTSSALGLFDRVEQHVTSQVVQHAPFLLGLAPGSTSGLAPAAAAPTPTSAHVAASSARAAEVQEVALVQQQQQQQLQEQQQHQQHQQQMSADDQKRQRRVSEEQRQRRVSEAQQLEPPTSGQLPLDRLQQMTDQLTRMRTQFSNPCDYSGGKAGGAHLPQIAAAYPVKVIPNLDVANQESLSTLTMTGLHGQVLYAEPSLFEEEEEVVEEEARDSFNVKKSPALIPTRGRRQSVWLREDSRCKAPHVLIEFLNAYSQLVGCPPHFLRRAGLLDTPMGLAPPLPARARLSLTLAPSLPALSPSLSNLHARSTPSSPSRVRVSVPRAAYPPAAITAEGRLVERGDPRRLHRLSAMGGASGHLAHHCKRLLHPRRE